MKKRSKKRESVKVFYRSGLAEKQINFTLRRKIKNGFDDFFPNVENELSRIYPQALKKKPKNFPASYFAFTVRDPKTKGEAYQKSMVFDAGSFDSFRAQVIGKLESFRPNFSELGEMVGSNERGATDDWELIKISVRFARPLTEKERGRSLQAGEARAQYWRRYQRAPRRYHRILKKLQKAGLSYKKARQKYRRLSDQARLDILKAHTKRKIKSVLKRRAKI